jgi:hypothetical protein
MVTLPGWTSVNRIPTLLVCVLPLGLGGGGREKRPILGSVASGLRVLLLPEEVPLPLLTASSSLLIASNMLSAAPPAKAAVGRARVIITARVAMKAVVKNRTVGTLVLFVFIFINNSYKSSFILGKSPWDRMLQYVSCQKPPFA